MINLHTKKVNKETKQAKALFTYASKKKADERRKCVRWVARQIITIAACEGGRGREKRKERERERDENCKRLGSKSV